MKCPLLNPRVYTTDSGHTITKGDCLKEECAWWNSHSNQCCLMSIGLVLNYMADYIHGIKDKMPHEEAP